MWDSIIIGGGSAGLSAALVLGRARRNVLLIDNNQPRNAPAKAAHGFFTQDGTSPLELLAIGRTQLLPYPSVKVINATVQTVAKGDNDFSITTTTGKQHSARTILLATGVRDVLPDIEGLADLWGNGVYHCPYCHGWEVRDQPLAIYGGGHANSIKHYLQLILNWSRDLVLCTNGDEITDEETLAWLQRWNIPVYTAPIARLEGNGDELQQIVFTNGESVARRGMFMGAPQEPRDDFGAQLGCEFTDMQGRRTLTVDMLGNTSVEGVYGAGDNSQMYQQIASAVASGSAAGAGINMRLIALDFA